MEAKSLWTSTSAWVAAGKRRGTSLEIVSVVAAAKGRITKTPLSSEITRCCAWAKSVSRFLLEGTKKSIESFFAVVVRQACEWE
jgi:hypothetical protein